MAGRLSREARRAQLIELGREAVVRSSFDEVSVEEVAEAAGISRGLLFHYFPTRRDFLVAIAGDVTDELLTVTNPDPRLDPLTRLLDGLNSYVDYIAARPAAYLSLVRGAAGGDPQMQQIADDARQVLADRVLDGVGLTRAHEGGDPLHTILARGWIAFIEESSVAWLRAGSPVDRSELIGVYVRSLATIAVQVADADEVVALAAAVLGTGQPSEDASDSDGADSELSTDGVATGSGSSE